MRVCTNEIAFDWIRSGRSKPEPHSIDPNWPGVPVNTLIPQAFENYVKVFHRIEGHYENVDDPLSPEERTVLNLPECEVLRDYVWQMRHGPDAPKLRWKGVAEVLGIPYQRHLSDEWFRAVLPPGCWPRYVYGPSEGLLEERDVVELIAIFAPASDTSNCYFRFAEMAYIGTGAPLLYCGALKSLVPFLKETDRQFTPEYWWPEDCSWCLCSDYDLSFTIVGGPTDLVNRVLASTSFESVIVTPDTRVDYRAPIE